VLSIFDNHILVSHFMLVLINLYYLMIPSFIPNLTSLLSALNSPSSLCALLHGEWYRKSCIGFSEVAVFHEFFVHSTIHLYFYVEYAVIESNF